MVQDLAKPLIPVPKPPVVVFWYSGADEEATPPHQLPYNEPNSCPAPPPLEDQL